MPLENILLLSRRTIVVGHGYGLFWNLFSLLLFISQNLIIILSISRKGLSRNRYCFVW